ncbi:hypothetical protein ElyMa_005157800 [Elysia marginata]|uniref:Uncharacterized protein n=1 Tax=Elysia marginata TaxID=1093978 RepID=A0AAV4JP28_9GAST|nr:hypothetical protein ElyMa_005157800 [Elysia marginata]
MPYRYSHLAGGSLQEVASFSDSLADIPSLTFVKKLFSGRRPPRNRKVYVDNKPLPGEETIEQYNYPDNRVESSKVISETALGTIESVLPHCGVWSALYTTPSHIILTPGRPDLTLNP